MEKINWKYPPYEEVEYKELCAKSKGKDFYYCVGQDLHGTTYAAITPIEYYRAYGDIWYKQIDVSSFLPHDHLTKYEACNIDDLSWHQPSIWLCSLSVIETQAMFHAYDFKLNDEFGKLIDLKYFKKPLKSDMEMDFEEFTSLIKETTENLKKMRAAQQYMRWQFGHPFFYEEFSSEMKETIHGWMSSHC